MRTQSARPAPPAGTDKPAAAAAAGLAAPCTPQGPHFVVPRRFADESLFLCGERVHRWRLLSHGASSCRTCSVCAGRTAGWLAAVEGSPPTLLLLALPCPAPPRPLTHPNITHTSSQAECFLREFAPTLRRHPPFEKAVNMQLNSHDPVRPERGVGRWQAGGQVAGDCPRCLPSSHARVLTLPNLHPPACSPFTRHACAWRTARACARCGWTRARRWCATCCRCWRATTPALPTTSCSLTSGEAVGAALGEGQQEGTGREAGNASERRVRPPASP